MSLLQLERIEVGQVGLKPGSVKMVSSDNLATITAAGYLNGIGTQIVPQVLLAPSDVIECLYSYNAMTDLGTLVFLQPSVSNGVYTLNVIPYPLSIPLANGDIFVGNASNIATAVALSGDATLSNLGVMTIANNAITTVKIANANVTLAKLSSGITPSSVVKFAAQYTTVGGAASEAITVTGALNTDLAFVQLVAPGTNTVSVVDAVVTANTLTVTFSGNPGNNAVINYQLLRAAS